MPAAVSYTHLNYAMLADRDNVDVITGTASFVSPHEVEVKTADKTLLLSGERIFINTGGETVIPPIEGVRENPRVYTSTTMLALEDLHRRLIILGGGYIALEFASFYAEFGSRVTILERGSRFLAREDEMCIRDRNAREPALTALPSLSSEKSL